jgi:hypothetical protein
MRILDWATRKPVMAHERARLSIGLESKNMGNEKKIRASA